MEKIICLQNIFDHLILIHTCFFTCLNSNLLAICYWSFWAWSRDKCQNVEVVSFHAAVPHALIGPLSKIPKHKKIIFGLWHLACPVSKRRSKSTFLYFSMWIYFWFMTFSLSSFKMSPSVDLNQLFCTSACEFIL